MLRTMASLALRWLHIATVLGCPAAVCRWLAPGSAERLTRLRSIDADDDFATVLVDLAAVLASVLTAWLVLTGVLTLVVCVRAPSARWSAWSRALTPPAWRALLAAALGLGLLSAPALASANTPSEDPHDLPTGPAPPPHVAGLTLPDLPSGGIGPFRARSIDQVRVRAGDSLWLIARDGLPAGAAPAAVAEATAEWYATNRAVIGPDPDLIHPGMSLRRPPPEGN